MFNMPTSLAEESRIHAAVEQSSSPLPDSSNNVVLSVSAEEPIIIDLSMPTSLDEESRIHAAVERSSSPLPDSSNNAVLAVSADNSIICEYDLSMFNMSTSLDEESRIHAAVEQSSSPLPQSSNNAVLAVSADESIIGEYDLNMIKMPSPIPRRGRLKGSETTVIGLPRKRKLCTGKSKLLPFLKMSPADKDRMLLGWLIKADVLPAILCGEQLIEVADIVPWLKIPTKVTDEPVEISWIRRYFSTISWAYLTSKLDMIKERNLWLCQACDNELAGAFVIRCDHCLNWFDRKCVGLKSEPKGKVWFCKSCLTMTS